jgi:hypothetical protein
VTRTAGDVGRRKHRERVLRSALGVLLIAAGIAVFLRAPEHATAIALLLVGLGGGFIEPSLVGNVIRSRMGGEDIP